MRDDLALLSYPIAWGRRLIETGDIDPVYEMLVGAQLPSDVLARWLIAYWCFYHVGVASFLAERPVNEFWTWCLIAAKNEASAPPTKGRWPRGTERRHFRGTVAVRAIEKLNDLYSVYPEKMVYVIVETVGQAHRIMTTVQEHPMFGPWIAFKAADMLDRVWGRDVHFTREIAMYDSPTKGAREIASDWGCTVEEVIDKMLGAIADLPAPGRKNRGCGIQELETIFCKHHSARTRHYWIGKDTAEIAHALKGWGAMAEELARYVPGTAGQ